MEVQRSVLHPPESGHRRTFYLSRHSQSELPVPQSANVGGLCARLPGDASQRPTPVIAPGQVLNAASFLGDLAPGGSATVYGTNLADGTPAIDATNGFPTRAGNVTLSVNGVNAPLIYASPTQINFRFHGKSRPALSSPSWSRAMVLLPPENHHHPDPSTSLFLSEYVNGLAWVTGSDARPSNAPCRPAKLINYWPMRSDRRTRPSRTARSPSTTDR